jgi:hypothetical protein
MEKIVLTDVKLPYNNILALPNTDAMKSDWRENDVN